MTSTELEQKRNRIDLFAKSAVLLAIGFVAAPIVVIAVPGLLGLVAAWAIGITAVNLAPIATMKFANWRLKVKKAEANKNPVETLQNDYGRRQEALEKFRESINTFAAKVQTFADRVTTFKAQYPEEVAKFANQLVKMQKLLELRKDKYRIARQELEKYAGEIEKAGAIWEMGQAAAELKQAAGMTEGDWEAKIMVETALNAVTENMNKAFAELETSLIDEEEDAADRKVGAQLKNSLDNATRNANTAPVTGNTLADQTQTRTR